MVEWGWTKQLLTMNPMEVHITKNNTTSDTVSYLVDTKKCLCQHEKLHPLTAIRVKWISETMYRDIKKLFNKTHKVTSLQREDTFYQLRN